MAFVDANVFVFAFLKPKRRLQAHEVTIKEAAKKIVSKISAGEQTICSVVHFSEVCNILEDHMALEEALVIEKGLLFRENIHFYEVSKVDYVSALSIMEQYHLGVNDALAYVLMRKNGAAKIYSFDKHFDRLPNVSRLTE
jgi:hypothetical protein